MQRQISWKERLLFTDMLCETNLLSQGLCVGGGVNKLTMTIQMKYISTTRHLTMSLFVLFHTFIGCWLLQYMIPIRNYNLAKSHLIITYFSAVGSFKILHRALPWYCPAPYKMIRRLIFMLLMNQVSWYLNVKGTFSTMGLLPDT